CRPAHKVAGGASTRQAVGSVRALVVSIATPNTSLSPISWQRQTGSMSTTPARPRQHPLPGRVRLLPASAYVKHDDKFSIAPVQSRAGGGAELLFLGGDHMSYVGAGSAAIAETCLRRQCLHIQEMRVKNLMNAASCLQLLHDSQPMKAT
ncbi:hypothetical protein BHE74_00012977, partial [Ensete ventricosum]